MLEKVNFTGYWEGGGGGSKKNFMWGGSALRSNPLPFYIPFLAGKIRLSYAFH